MSQEDRQQQRRHDGKRQKTAPDTANTTEREARGRPTAAKLPRVRARQRGKGSTDSQPSNQPTNQPASLAVKPSKQPACLAANMPANRSPARPPKQPAKRLIADQTSSSAERPLTCKLIDSLSIELAQVNRGLNPEIFCFLSTSSSWARRMRIRGDSSQVFPRGDHRRSMDHVFLTGTAETLVAYFKDVRRSIETWTIYCGHKQPSHSFRTCTTYIRELDLGLHSNVNVRRIIVEVGVVDVNDGKTMQMRKQPTSYL